MTKTEYHVIKEEFDSISSLMNTLKSRKNNKYMKDQHYSEENDEEFSGSKSYEESEQLIRGGYTKILPQVKERMGRMEKDLQSEFIKVPKIRPKNSIVGYVPNIPNAILGLPESMIDSVRISQKQKTIDIIYIMGANCSQDAKLFIDAGIVLLSAIKILESNRISVKLKVCFMPSEEPGEITVPTVLVKDYSQRLDLQKLCFPLAHPSMFRRIGFKWLETSPDITTDDFALGYGRSPVHGEEDLKTFIEKANLAKDQRIISAQVIRSMGFDVQKLLNFLKTNENAKSSHDKKRGK